MKDKNDTQDDQSLCKGSVLRLYLPDGLILRLMSEVCIRLCYYLMESCYVHVHNRMPNLDGNSSHVSRANLIKKAWGLLALGAGYGIVQTLGISIKH